MSILKKSLLDNKKEKSVQKKYETEINNYINKSENYETIKEAIASELKVDEWPKKFTNIRLEPYDSTNSGIIDSYTFNIFYKHHIVFKSIIKFVNNKYEIHIFGKWFDYAWEDVLEVLKLTIR